MTVQTPSEPRGIAFGWIHTIYLAIPLFQPLFDPVSDGWDWAIAIGIAVLGGVLYFVSLLRVDLARWYSAVPLTVLAVATMPLNAGASVLLVYAASAAGRVENRANAIRWFIGLTILLLGMSVVIPAPLPWRLFSIIPSLLFIWVIGLVCIEEAERAREASELRLRNARIEHLATITERERIARDLHDLLGHSLTAVVMRAQLIGADPSRAVTEAAEIERTARDALAEVRNALSGWRQASLEREVETARGALASADVELVVRRETDLVLIGSTEHELALALREAVTNVARHARARTCHIGIHCADDELRLVIADDGVGGKSREGNGLTGIRERVTALGGRMDRTTSAGTIVTIAVPLAVAV